MMKSTRTVVLALTAIVCVAAGAGPRALAADSSSGVIKALEQKYVVTETTSDMMQVTKDGTTMSMKCAGVYSVPGYMANMKVDNKVVEGKVQAPGGMAKIFLVKMGAHVLQTGDKVYITKLESKSDGGGDVLKFTLLTVDALDVSGSDAKKKFAASVSFKFKKGYLDETPPDQVEQMIEGVLAPDTGDEAKAEDPAPAKPAPPAPVATVRPAPVAPPPPPQIVAPATITIGETSTEVLQAMGMPLQMVDLGKKKTYVYKNMKVVFMNDKVSDVQ